MPWYICPKCGRDREYNMPHQCNPSEKASDLRVCMVCGEWQAGTRCANCGAELPKTQ